MRFQKYPDSCGRGLRVEEESLLITSQLCFKMNFYLITSVRTPLTPTQETPDFSLLRPLHRSTSDARHIFRQERQKIGATVTPIS